MVSLELLAIVMEFALDNAKTRLILDPLFDDMPFLKEALLHVLMPVLDLGDLLHEGLHTLSDDLLQMLQVVADEGLLQLQLVIQLQGA